MTNPLPPLSIAEQCYLTMDLMLYEALTEKDYPGAGVYVAEEDGTQRLLSREESLKVLQRSVDLAKAHGISLDD